MTQDNEGNHKKESEDQPLLPVWSGAELESWRFGAEKRFCTSWNKRCRRAHFLIDTTGEGLDHVKYTVACLVSVYDGIRRDISRKERTPDQKAGDCAAQREVLELIDVLNFTGTYQELVEADCHYNFSYYQWMSAYEVIWNVLNDQVHKTIRALAKAGWDGDAEALRQDWVSYQPELWYCATPEHDKPSRPRAP